MAKQGRKPKPVPREVWLELKRTDQFDLGWSNRFIVVWYDDLVTQGLEEETLDNIAKETPIFGKNKGIAEDKYAIPVLEMAAEYMTLEKDFFTSRRYKVKYSRRNPNKLLIYYPE